MKTSMKKSITLTLVIAMLSGLMTACGAKDAAPNYAAPADNGGNNKNYEQFIGSPQEAYDGADEAYDEGDVDIAYAPEAEAEMPYEEEYHGVVESGFMNTLQNPLSTFSADVDTASYANVRRMITNGEYVNPDAVRLEEMINYFNYDYPNPSDDAPFSVTTEMYDCPWNDENQLFLVGLQAEKLDLSNRPPMNLVFLIDVSGSMYSSDKLPLAQQAVNMLAEQLTADDRISIVTYSGKEEVVLEGVAGNDYATISKAVNNLVAGGATAGERGIVMAYEIAQKYFIEGGNNRVLLATDGDLNVGLSSEEELTQLITEKRETGVNLSVLGFGTGNLKDDRLEALADNGNGNYSYIDSIQEAQKVLLHEMGGTLFTVAKDVKLQTEFNPEMVESYRLIGYENRTLKAEDFNDDSVDAGEIGAGHTVTALYELVLTDKAKLATNNIELKYQPAEDTPIESELMTISMRYKAPDGDTSQLKEYPIKANDCHTSEMGKNLAFASAVTEFGMLVGQRSYAGTSSYEQIVDLCGKTDIQDSYRQEFMELAKLAKSEGVIN